MNSQILCVGVYNLSRRFLEERARKGKRVHLRIVGFLVVEDGVTPDLVRRTVERVSLRGQISGPPGAVAALRERQR